MTKKECGKIQNAEMQFLRNTLNYTLQARIRNEDIRADLVVEDINEIISIYKRQWWITAKDDRGWIAESGTEL